MKTILLFLSLCSIFGSYSDIKEDSEWQSFFNAIGQVESNNNDSAIGDNGKSVGRYQIKVVYIMDAWNVDRTEAEKIHKKLASDPALGRETIYRYMSRYAPDSVRQKEWAKLAAIHNRGPSARKLSNEECKKYEYVQKVLKTMENQ